MRLPWGIDRLLEPSLWRLGLGERPLEARDPEFIRAELPRIEKLVEGWHDIQVDGLANVPEGRALAVGNHNGGVMAPDMFALMVAFWRTFGPEMPSYGLMHDFIISVPGVGGYMARLGAVPASPAHATALLERDAKVLVYPGGDLDAFKPSARRNEIVFGGRRGFVRIALRTRAPIVPVVSVGAHESFYVITDGADLARRSGLKRLTRLEVVPVIAALPWGLFVGPLPYLPLKARIKVQILAPMRWPELPPEAADDTPTVERCVEEVRARMQSALDALVAQGGWGVRVPLARGAG